MKNCLNCNNPVKQIEGKRQRKYCSDSCRQVHWQKNKKKIPIHKSKCIELPQEYRDFTNIGLLNTDGTIEVLGRKTANGIEWVNPKVMHDVPAWAKTFVYISKEVNLNSDNKEQSAPCEDLANKMSNEEIEKQIEAIKAEKIPSHITTSMGKKSWNFDQQKKINELKNKL
jgi:endogenous inhibitor of DNA gyrase (YacG/DUF329 family)